MQAGWGLMRKLLDRGWGLGGSDVNWVEVSLARGGLIYDGYHSHFLALKP